ncbi:sugar transporter SWEET1-like [Toxorhynchites rutilus septentrionalis]|uniref:sugar transporter SWEET1-like n=1 Tax=Toxorhynchites rutilus septentrionalis TaxID=329112 RepID=UPI002479C4FF|nr:sugar transporter SWEET1-like [Toxorhynchites rutilus septentrionalis]
MESLARGLLPYRDVIGNVAGILTVTQFLSGCFTCNKIRLKGSSESFSALQFVFGCGLTALQLKYSLLLGAAALIRTSAYALAICLVYSGWFLYFTPANKRKDFWKLTIKTFLLTCGVLLYAGYEKPQNVLNRFGLIVTVLTLSYIALPLLKLGEVIRRKSSEGLPLPVILASTGASLLWLLYGIILRNHFIIIQKVIALGLCAVQLSLFIIYPAASTAASETASRKVKRG